ncbi:hypothetical protein FPV67DRAFT_1402757 [Lyophyllum atratum]|nr:hypothetical protein FPV67DRAFT_1402757 [Lyophyllum atratum]
MPRFLAGDELGNIKSVCYSSDAGGETKTATKTLHNGASCAVQVLAVGPSSAGSQLLAAGFSDGTASAFSLEDSDALKEVQQWRETRLRDDHRYIGLEISEKGILSCTSNGALRLTPSKRASEPVAPLLAALPARLHAWRMSLNQKSFAYGGNEVDLSLWDTETAFSPPKQLSESEHKKRKRDALFPGEVWRGRNVNNDSLGLRQPLRITSLTYLTPSSTSNHLAAGTDLGNVRRYDTRAARRPVSDWKVGKVGGIKAVEMGMSEHELFVSDHGYNFFALDLRNGKVAYGYKGLSGTVTSVAPSPSILASTALDRYVRIHSTFPPPGQVGQQQEQKGEVLDKVYMKSIPTVIVWNHAVKVTPIAAPEDEDVWENMETAEGYSDDEESRSRKKR